MDLFKTIFYFSFLFLACLAAAAGVDAACSAFSTPSLTNELNLIYLFIKLNSYLIDTFIKIKMKKNR